MLTGEIPTLFKISLPRLVCLFVEFTFMDFREGLTHFNKSILPSFDDLLQGLERKLRYCRRSFHCGIFDDHTSLEQQALVSGRKIEIFFPKDFLGAKRQVAPIRASTMKPICREDFAKSKESGKSERCPVNERGR